tara:strand:- start:982 stop:1470 length:489 start_codon:yes stop_codon:yes gene_type:complete
VINQFFFTIIFTTLLLAGCEKNEDKLMSSKEDKIKCESVDQLDQIQIVEGLKAKILKKGFGRAAVKGDYAKTNVWLWLYDESSENNRGKFIWESGSSPFEFQLGANQVIKGWDLGVPCMLEGETRELIIDGDLAYGSSGAGEIPPDATLIFVIELLKLTATD